MSRSGVLLHDPFTSSPVSCFFTSEIAIPRCPQLSFIANSVPVFSLCLWTVTTSHTSGNREFVPLPQYLVTTWPDRLFLNIPEYLSQCIGLCKRCTDNCITVQYSVMRKFHTVNCRTCQFISTYNNTNTSL